MFSKRSFVLLLVCLLLVACGNIMKKESANLYKTVCANGCDFQLIQAAVDSQDTAAGDTIEIKDPVHTEAGILISKNIILQGSGTTNTVLQAHEDPAEATQRVIEVPADANVTIRDLTIQHGNPRILPLTGGGILNYGTLLLENVMVSENYGHSGGGIYNEGTLTLINSSISHNGSIGGGETYQECETGGGLKVMTGTVTLINSTIEYNQSLDKGGGVHVACNGTLILQNSTISSNYTKTSGGGVFLNGTGQFIHSTITNNSANNVGGIAIEGKGKENEFRGKLTLTNSIVANNIGRMEGFGVADCNINLNAELQLLGVNWIGDGTCGAEFSGDAMLGPLADNGGGTLTHQLLSGSPAINAIPAEFCTLTEDQRGEPRNTLCDIGAYEEQNP